MTYSRRRSGSGQLVLLGFERRHSNGALDEVSFQRSILLH